MKLTREQIKLLNELKIRYDYVRADIAVNDSPSRLSDAQYAELIKNRINQEREFFATKHNLPAAKIGEMLKAYNELEDIEEYHQFLDYYEVCNLEFYRNLRDIIREEVHVENCALARSFIPHGFISHAHEKYQNKVEKRVERCENALRKFIPRMTLYKYENIKYGLQYRIDHWGLKKQEFEKELVKELCEYALAEDYKNSFWRRVVNRYLLS